MRHGKPQASNPARVATFLTLATFLALAPYPATAADPIAFSPADSYALAASAPFRMATGDLDGDGDLDVVVAHDNANYSVLLNDGAGGFTAATYGAGSRLRDVAIILLDGDAIPDLVFSDWTAKNVRVLRGVGGGVFTAFATYAADNGADGIVKADFNGDGIDDVAACIRNSQEVSVYLGQAGGGLGAKTDFPAGGYCFELAVGQVNAGPELDLVTANYTSDNIGVLLGDGAGGFTTTAIVAGNDNFDLALGDLNADGNLDVALGSAINDNVRLLLGDGLGGYIQARALAGCNGPNQVRLADQNGNGHLDVLAACKDGAPGLAVWLQHGYLNFTAVRTYHADNATNGLAIANLDAGVLPDIATVQTNNTVRVLKQLLVDTDADLIADVDEVLIGTSPTDPDSDDDLMPDGWEMLYWRLEALAPDAGADGDGDLIANLDEYRAATVPCDLTDSDADGMPDGWEELHYGCMQINVADADADYDLDGRTNLDEYRYRSLPCDLTDTDADGMPDGWEDRYPCVDKLVGDSTQDPDADTADNLAEYLGLTDPCVQNDADADGMPDHWENAHPCLNPAVNDASLDSDADYSSNLTEFANATDPCLAEDTDGDGMIDGWEDLYPCVDKLVGDSTLDPDLDTVDNLAEFLALTNPCVQNDADADGMPDHWENAHPCMNPAVNDAGLDYDFDSATNLVEYNASTDPCLAADTDADLMPDGWEDLYPCVNKLVGDSTLDPDLDTVDNLAEFLARTDPCLANDRDFDQMPDYWEVLYFCVNPYGYDAEADYDSDDRDNYHEYLAGTNPCVKEDGDSDGMPDGWEEQFPCLDPGTADAELDPDNDLVVNLDEYHGYSNPCVANDTDGDGMPDTWENAHPCMNPAFQDGDLDYDHDLLTNFHEFQHDTDPCLMNDADGDLMPDGWERLWPCVNELVPDATLDPDNDTVNNLGEYLAGRNPCAAEDTDADGMPDHYEAAHPCLKPLVKDATVDYDADAVTSLLEYQRGTDPCLWTDSDGDGMSDGYEDARACLNRLVPEADLDPDLDGLGNLAEFQHGTNPCNLDSDADGMDDGWESQHPCLNPTKKDHYRNPDFDTDANYREYQNDTDPCVMAPRGRVCVVVPSTLQPLIGPALAQYQHDLEQVGFTVIFHSYTSETPPQLRAILAGLYAEPASLEGAVLVGAIPFIRFHDPGEDFPCDLFYMDLDGTWTDSNSDGIYESHSGEYFFEIWVSRLKADNLPMIGNEADVLNAYLDKDHRYRTGALAPDSRALIYQDGGLVCGNPRDVSVYVTEFERIYGPGAVTVDSDRNKSFITGNLFQHSFEWVDWGSHASTTCFAIGSSCGTIFGYCACSNAEQLCNTDFLAYDPTWFFSVMGGCGASNYMTTNYVTGVMTFNPANSGLVTMGSTRGMDPTNIRFMTEFTTAGTVGAILQNWFNYLVATLGVDPINFYGGVMIGDGTLQLRMIDGDYDHDGLSNRDEQEHPCLDAETMDQNLDPDGDGLSNLAENALGADPCAADSDQDSLPDGYEAANSSGHDPGQILNPLDSADATADFDGDGNQNVNEFWNGSDPWAADPIPDPFQNPGCYYWADSDGDGVIGPGDLMAVKDEVATGLPTYASVLPRGVFDTQDIDKDGAPGPSDIASIKEMVIGVDRPSGYPSMPISLGVVSAPGGAVDVGDTCHVTVEVVNQALAVPRSGSFAVVFSIDPASDGSAILLGGDGEDLGQSFANRYDISGLSTAGGRANIVLQVTAPGTIIVNAKVPACGIGTTGRWCAEVVLNPAVMVTVE